MVSWHDTQAFFIEHWRPLLIVSLVVVVIVVAISLTLVLVLKRKPTPTPSAPPFNGPLDVNGDPAQNSNLFAYPQLLNNPVAGATLFGANTFVHEAGYLAASVTLPGSDALQAVLFYYTNLSGELQGPQSMVLDFLPSGYRVCNGVFAPIFNRNREVYYLFLSVGTVSASGNVCPRYVIVCSLDTATTSNAWTIGNVNTEYAETLSNPARSSQEVVAMKLPNHDFVWDAARPWYGTFGAKLQVVLDDNEAIVKQSLYISGSEFDSNLPGGNLYWFVLLNNDTDPQVALLYTIQDAKLLMMQQQGSNCPAVVCTDCTGKGTSCVTFDSTSEQACVNGFASDFYVTSGSRANNILVIANSTPQDNCVLGGSQQTCAPKGYIQGYILTSQGVTQSWVQPRNGLNNFQYRYLGISSDPSLQGGTTTFGGFANSVSVINGSLFVGQGVPEPQSNAGLPGLGTFLVLPWVSSPNANGGNLNPTSVLKPTAGAAAPFLLSDMYPLSAEGLRYNQGVQLINDGSNQLLATSWFAPAPADVLSVQTPSGGSSSGSGSSSQFASFELVQSLGAGYSSQSAASPQQSLVGFGQIAGTWLSRTGASVRLVFNDPSHNSNSGRLVVLTRKRQS